MSEKPNSEKPNSEIKTNANKKLGFFYKFFCWCSGARLYLLKSCPSEYNKYFGIGAVVFMTGVMATITGSYALYTVFENIIIASVFGLFWGFLIFFLDWYIVASLKKEKKFLKELVSAMPRLILAILIAFVISKPLELKLFEQEIEKQLTLMNEESKQKYINKVDNNFKEINRLKAENEQYIQQIEKKETKRDNLFRMIIAEAEGRSPTNIKGKGPVYKEKKAEFDKAEEELKEIKQRNNQLIEANNKRILELRSQKGESVKEKQQVYSDSGFLSRLKALSALSSENRAVRYANVFIIILFIIVESAPMIVKLMSNRGPYDHLLESTEHKRNLETLAMEDEDNLKYTKKKYTETELQNTYYSSKLQSEKEKIDQAFALKKKIDEKKMKKWEEIQLEKLENETETSIKPLDDLLSNNHKIISD
jgi:hypothetical protein